MPRENTMPEGTDAIIEGAGVVADDTMMEDDVGEPDEAGETEDDGKRQITSPTPAAEAKPAAAASTATAQSLRESLMGGIDGITGKAGDTARDFVQAGKDRATSAIDEVVRMIEDAAEEIDAKLGSQYGDYARRAAGSVDGIAQTIKDKDVDVLFADARALIGRSPGVAAGVAAALGFVVARIVRAGLSGETPVDTRAA